MAAASAGEPTINALGQFQLHTVFGAVGRSVNFTQSNLLMLIASVVILALLYFGMRPRAVIPGRLQALAEMSYQSVLGMTVGTIGEEGRRYFPFVFTLFFFILVGGLLGLFPYSFTYTSHIAITFALTVLVFVIVLIESLRLHGLHFFSYFFPPGTPKLLAPLIVPIEIMSYLSRLISLSVRLFANMMAGHVMMEVFGAFAVMLGALGIIGWAPAVVSEAVNVILVGFEILVIFLQSYVFAILTCIYLHDAVHLH